jgi:hypothetical protein
MQTAGMGRDLAGFGFPRGIRFLSGTGPGQECKAEQPRKNPAEETFGAVALMAHGSRGCEDGMLPVIRQFFLFGNDKELRNARGIGGPATPSL